MGFLFSIISPAIFGINNYIDKFLLEKQHISPMVVSIYGGISAFIVGLIILFITGFYPINIISFFVILFSGFLTTIYLLPYYKALSIDETSYVIPLFQFYPVFVVLLGFIFLRETFSVLQYVGSMIIIFAAFLLSVEKLNKKIFRVRKSFFYMLLSCLLFAFAQILYKFGVKEIPFWNTLPYEGFGIALGALAIFLYRDNKKKFIKETRRFKKRVFLFVTINELVYLIARYTGYFAISLISVSLVSILAGFQPLFVLIYGIILSVWFPQILKEVMNRKVIMQKVISIMFMFLGLYFIFS